MHPTLIWHGTRGEAEALARAVARYCTCDIDRHGVHRGPPCPAHRMLVEDQRVLDGLLWARRVRTRLMFEEFRS